MFGVETADELEQFASYCALPSKAIIPDPTAPEYTIYDGYCLCDPSTSPSSWYSWCSPPSHFPSQITLSPINSTTYAVNCSNVENLFAWHSMHFVINPN